VCTTPEQAAEAIDAFGPPYVVKDDGLAAGKGVVVTSDRDEALQHAAGCEQVLIEEYLDGPEVSLFAITDGTTVLPMQPAQDFKRLADNDEGPNTGGMGAYTPLPWAPEKLVEEITEKVLQPTVDELRRRGTPFSGLLYAGLALTSRGVRVIEFNCRFGDPETQALLPLLNTPLGGLLYAAATGKLADHGPLSWKNAASVTVVVAAKKYPASPRKGDVITGIEQAETDDVRVFHAGTALDGEELVTSGGRVLAVSAIGTDLDEARQRAYAGVGQIRIKGSQHRTDIALKAARGEITV
jgi:phosphoribosylamine--glycine ligase